MHGSTFPGYLHIYDVLVLNLAVQACSCALSYTSILLTLLILALVSYSLSLQRTSSTVPQAPVAIRRKYSKHKH